MNNYNFVERSNDNPGLNKPVLLKYFCNNKEEFIVGYWSGTRWVVDEVNCTITIMNVISWYDLPE